MHTFSAFLSLTFCFHACFSTPVLKDVKDEPCVVESSSLLETSYFPGSPLILNSEINMYQINPPPQVTIVLPQFTEVSDEDPKSEVEALSTVQADNTAAVESVHETQHRVNGLTEFQHSTRTHMDDMLDQMEQRVRINDLIFTNVREGKYETYSARLEKVLLILTKVMNVRAEPDDISVAVRKDTSSPAEVRPIVVTFLNYAMKLEVLAARNTLRNTNIEILENISAFSNKRRTDLLPYLEEKTAQGYDAFILQDKLVVDGVKMSLEDLEAEKRNGETKEEGEISKEQWREEKSWRSFENYDYYGDIQE